MGKLKTQDVIDLDDLLDTGVQLTYNDKVRGEPIAGEGPYVGLLCCFLGDKPADPDLTAGLLRGPVGWEGANDLR